MTIQDAIEALKGLPADRQDVVVKLITMLSANGEERATPPQSWRGILKGRAPSVDEMREARRASWDLGGRDIEP